MDNYSNNTQQQGSKKRWLYLGLGLAVTGVLSFFGFQYWRENHKKSKTAENKAPDFKAEKPKANTKPTQGKEPVKNVPKQSATKTAQPKTNAKNTSSTNTKAAPKKGMNAANVAKGLYTAAMLAKGLKNDSKKSPLSGIENNPLIITIVPTRVWKDPRTSVSVPANMVLGRELERKKNFSMFASDNQYFLVESSHVNYYKK